MSTTCSHNHKSSAECSDIRDSLRFVPPPPPTTTCIVGFLCVTPTSCAIVFTRSTPPCAGLSCSQTAERLQVSDQEASSVSAVHRRQKPLIIGCKSSGTSAFGEWNPTRLAVNLARAFGVVFVPGPPRSRRYGVGEPTG